MTEHNIDLSKLETDGKVFAEVQDGILHMTTSHAHSLHHCKPEIRCLHYAKVPGSYRVPLRIDINAKIDVPLFFVMFGEGHVDFGDRSSNRHLDIIGKPPNKASHYNSRIPLNKFTNITLIYDLNEMQILINSDERYYSKHEKYMKSPLFKEMNSEGFPLGISCTKRTNLEIQSICISEYNDTAGIVHTGDFKEDKFLPPTEKPAFESSITRLPDKLRTAIINIDGWLRSLSPIKFKRQIGKYGEKITYVASEQGFSYAIYISDDVMYHTLQWYILTQGKPETWKRKADRMEDTLNHLAKTDSAFACRMFNNLYECLGGYGPGCLAKTPYSYADKKITSCHGKLFFNMNLSEFDDVKRFIGALNEITDTGGMKDD